MRARLLPLLPAALSLAFAPAPLPKADPAREDLARMQGAWVLSYSVERGVKTPAAQEAVWRIEGDRVTTSLAGKKASSFRIVLRGSKRPRTIDVVPDEPGRAAVPGRYSVEGEVLKICLGQRRPADLSGDPPSNGLWVMARLRR
jgi:uncharacterized protein (TIGR03067 family)